MTITVAQITPLVALIAGILILAAVELHRGDLLDHRRHHRIHTSLRPPIQVGWVGSAAPSSFGAHSADLIDVRFWGQSGHGPPHPLDHLCCY